MKILVINAGSSSLKYQLIDMESEQAILKGLCERITFDGGELTQKTADGRVLNIKQNMKDHTQAIELVLKAMVDPVYGAIKSTDEISAVGHRVLHSGEDFKSSVVIDDEVIRICEKNAELGPLHMPGNIACIKSCREVMPGVPMVAVFDTTFHSTMPAKAYMYGIPYSVYDQYKVRKYGFHGTSHRFVSARCADVMGEDIKKLKIVTCHLGNGSSITAVKYGKCIDTSMGLTPLEGLIMGTRSGDLDPAIIEYLCNHENLTVSEMLNILNKKSGVLGMSGGISSDFRDLNAAANEGNEIAKVTLEAYAYRVAKYIGSYTAAMNGVDAITFTAGVGENAAWLRPMVCKYLGFLGVKLDEAASEKACGVEGIISTADSKVKLCVIPTNEELAIARETARLVK